MKTPAEWEEVFYMTRVDIRQLVADIQDEAKREARAEAFEEAEKEARGHRHCGPCDRTCVGFVADNIATLAARESVTTGVCSVCGKLKPLEQDHDYCRDCAATPPAGNDGANDK